MLTGSKLMGGYEEEPATEPLPEIRYRDLFGIAKDLTDVEYQRAARKSAKPMG